MKCANTWNVLTAITWRAVTRCKVMRSIGRFIIVMFAIISLSFAAQSCKALVKPWILKHPAEVDNWLPHKDSTIIQVHSKLIPYIVNIPGETLIQYRNLPCADLPNDTTQNRHIKIITGIKGGTLTTQAICKEDSLKIQIAIRDSLITNYRDNSPRYIKALADEKNKTAIAVSRKNDWRAAFLILLGTIILFGIIFTNLSKIIAFFKK